VNVKRYFIAVLCVCVASQVVEYLIHGLILASAYEATSELWRPDMDSYTWVFSVVGLVWSVLFVYIFIKGYEGRGIMEGVRYGFLIGLFVGFPMAYGSYAMMPMPYSLALQWFLYTVVECVVLGVVAAAVYRPKPSAPLPAM